MTTPIGSSDGEREAIEVEEALLALHNRLDECSKNSSISAADAYDSFYRDMVVEALAGRGQDVPWVDVTECPHGVVHRYACDICDRPDIESRAALSSDREMAPQELTVGWLVYLHENDFEYRIFYDECEAQTVADERCEPVHRVVIARSQKPAPEFKTGPEGVALWKAARNARDREMAPEAKAKDSVNQTGAQGGEPEAAGYVNGDELDNMLDDRTATIFPQASGSHRTPLYTQRLATLPAAYFLNDAAEGQSPHYAQVAPEYIGHADVFPLYRVLGASAKYDDVLAPFVALMRAELHANSGKGDRPGWLLMSREQGLLEIYWHTAKLSVAVKNNDAALIREHAADVANMALMLLDVCGGLASSAHIAQRSA